MLEWQPRTGKRAVLVDPQRGGQTTLSTSQVAAGSKRLRTVEFGTPYKRPMSTSGSLSDDVIMMMMIKIQIIIISNHHRPTTVSFCNEKGLGRNPPRWPSAD
ncbi:jg22623 [Pararge aegeria aegeria]|uniref:Jg22623 protein n=1 Tax=Pararge aegeria aegeria TaxID=348720 RepID=A0A8S4SBB0_9NEOP|nr:jg22623 [Pararge aegeria aegeria]